jgi:uncharacterized protein with HEPN domain
MQIDPQIEARAPELWRHLDGAYGMRIKLTHGYRSVDAAVVWNTITLHLPYLDELVLREAAKNRP